MSSAAAVGPNTLRGQVRVVEDSSDEEEEEGDGEGKNDGARGMGGKGMGKGSGVDWGKKARRRQRRLIRGILEAEEKLRREEEEADSDREIEEFLVT